MPADPLHALLTAYRQWRVACRGGSLDAAGEAYVRFLWVCARVEREERENDDNQD